VSDLLEFTKWLAKEYAVENAVIGLRQGAEADALQVMAEPSREAALLEENTSLKANAEGWHREFLGLQNKLGLIQKFVENHQQWADQKRTEALNANDQSASDQYEEVMAWATEVLKELAK
jgi:hypothetical protein